MQCFELNDGIGRNCEEKERTSKSGGGLLIVEPETVFSRWFCYFIYPLQLISSTQLAQAHYCPRKAVFQDRFRSSGSNLAMTVGTIAHELFQVYILLFSINLILSTLQVALLEQPNELSGDWLFRLYRKQYLPKICLDLVAMQCTLERFEEELRLYLDNIAQWIKVYFV